MQGVAAHRLNQANERANRANDLQQISGLYNILKQRDLTQQIMDGQANRPHVRDPALDQIEQKYATLSGMPGLAGGGPLAQPPIQAPSQQVPQQAPQQSGPLMSTPQNPQFQIPGGISQQGQMPPMPQIPQDPMKALRDQADLYAAMSGKPELIAENLYKRAIPAFSRGVSFDQSTGQPIAGFVDNVPVGRGADGSFQVQPNNIAPAIADRAGQVAAAQTGTHYTNVPTGNGQTEYMTNAEYAYRKLGIRPPGQTSPPATLTSNGTTATLGANGALPVSTVSPQTQGARDGDRRAVLEDELKRVMANPDKNMTIQAGNIAALRKEIAALPRTIAPAQSATSLGVTPDPVTQTGLMAGSKGVGEVYGDAYKEIRAKGSEAPMQASMLREMLALTQGALAGQTGAFAPMRQKWTEYLASAGVPQNVIDQLPQTIHNLPEAQDFVKLATQRAMSQTRTMGAREAASVFNQVQAANPNMSLTTPAMAKIIQPLLAEQDWNAAKFKAADQWLAGHNNNLAGFESDWNANHPFTEFWKGSEQAKPSQTVGGWSIRKVN